MPDLFFENILLLPLNMSPSVLLLEFTSWPTRALLLFATALNTCWFDLDSVWNPLVAILRDDWLLRAERRQPTPIAPLMTMWACLRPSLLKVYKDDCFLWHCDIICELLERWELGSLRGGWEDWFEFVLNKFIACLLGMVEIDFFFESWKALRILKWIWLNWLISGSELKLRTIDLEATINI